MILRETFARTIPFGEEYIFLIRNHWAFFGFCVLFLLFKGRLKVWMMVWSAYEKQPALCFPNVQAAFLCFSFSAQYSSTYQQSGRFLSAFRL